MNKIQTLVAELKNPVPQKNQNRIDKLEKLEGDLKTAKELNETEPSDENQEEVDELNGIVIELSESICEQLEAIITEENKQTPPAPIVNPNTPPRPKGDEKPNGEEKKSNKGFFILAGVIAVVTLGTVWLKNRE